MPARTLTPDFNEEVVKIRDQEYRLRELSIGEYEDLVKKATTERTNPITGEEEEQTDNTLLLKFMVLKCVVEPKISAEKLAELPMRVVLKLNQTVNRMHYGDEPTEEVEAGEEDEEEKKGND
jgi:hypothetical protein